MSVPSLTLKVDVDTLRGTLVGVPRLVELFRRHRTDATFLFSLGPDHTGWAIRRVFRRGFLGKVKRTSVIEHYGLKTLLPGGTLLPGPDIGRRAGDVMRRVRDAGFEIGIHCWDHVLWQDHVAGADREWTAQQMRKAVDRYAEIFGIAATAHGAAGWQMNGYALRLAEEQFAWCSDSRGTHPFLPIVDGKTIHSPQLPTTLPTLDELIGVDGTTPINVADRLLAITQTPRATGHVFALHAELEGFEVLPILDRLPRPAGALKVIASARCARWPVRYRRTPCRAMKSPTEPCQGVVGPCWFRGQLTSLET